jgi:hypothetical protein
VVAEKENGMNKHQGPDDVESESPEKLETDDRYAREGYTSGYAGDQEPKPDYDADERPDVAEQVKPIPDDELPDAATDADAAPLDSPPISQ